MDWGFELKGYGLVKCVGLRYKRFWVKGLGLGGYVGSEVEW